MSEVILYNSDCIQAMTEIADHSINLILTDPPYNLGNFMKSRDTNLKKMRENFFGAAGWDNLEYDEWANAMDAFFAQAARVMKKGGSMIVFMAAIKVETTISLAEKHGFYYKTTGIWHKLNPMPRNMNLHFVNSTETWIYFTYKTRTGGMSVDPDDNTPGGVRASGARIVTYGAPVLPGAMFLLGYFEDGMPVMGLPGCVMYAGATIFDLMLPYVAADVPVTRADVAALGEGGLCLGCPECHFPICPFGK